LGSKKRRPKRAAKSEPFAFTTKKLDEQLLCGQKRSLDRGGCLGERTEPWDAKDEKGGKTLCISNEKTKQKKD